MIFEIESPKVIIYPSLKYESEQLMYKLKLYHLWCPSNDEKKSKLWLKWYIYI